MNNKLAQKDYKGVYHIFISVLYKRENTNPLIGVDISKDESPAEMGVLTIKNRMLLNLD